MRTHVPAMKRNINYIIVKVATVNAPDDTQLQGTTLAEATFKMGSAFVMNCKPDDIYQPPEEEPDEV